MLCVNGHPMEVGQQFCAVCGGQAAAPAAPVPPAAAPPAPSFGAPPAAAPPFSAGPPPAGPPAVPPTPPGAAMADQMAQMEAQAAKLAPAKTQLLAAALVLAGALIDFSAFIAGVTYESHGVSGTFKYRLETFANQSIVVGIILVVAAYLASSASSDDPKAVDLGKKATLGVLAVAAFTVLTILLGLLGDLGVLGDSFGQGVSSFVGHVAALVLVLGAAAGAMANRSTSS